MPFPILPILAGLGAAAGIGSAGTAIGTTLADRRKAKKAEKARQEAVKKAQTQAKKDMAARVAALKNGTPGAVPTGPMSSPFNQNTPEGFGTYTVYSPEQQYALNFALQKALSGLGSNQFDFAPIEQRARTQFAQQTVPGIAERFTAMQGQRSNAFAQQLGQSASDLESQLAGLRQGHNLEQQRMLQNLLALGLQPQYEAYLNPNSPSGAAGNDFLKSLAAGLITPEGVRAALGGIGDIAGAIQKRRAAQQAASAAEPLGALATSFPGMPSSPSVFNPTPVIRPNSALGSIGAPGSNLGTAGFSPSVMAPSSMVPGLSVPSGVVPGIGGPIVANPAMPLPTSNIGAMKSLYGF